MSSELELKVQKKHRVLSAFIIFCGLMYIFMYQLKLPFRADVFLYGMIAGLGIVAIYNNYLAITKQFILFLLIDLSALIGCMYTPMEVEGWREFKLFALFSGMFIFSFSNRAFVKSFSVYIYWASVIVVVSAIMQFVLPGVFNSAMASILRPDAYEQLMWSFTVDNAYAGVAAYTPNTTFAAAIVAGNSFLGLTNKEEPVVKNRSVNLILLVLALFSIILCSKRGLFVASIVGILVLMFYLYRGQSFFLRFMAIAVLAVLVSVILYNVNDSVAAFFDRFTSGKDFTTGRDVIYESLLSRLNINNIWFGLGTAATYEVANAGAHNIYIQILYDHGAVLAIPYYYFLLYNYWLAFVNRRPISIFVQTVFLVYGLSGNPLYSNMLMIIYIYHVLYATPEKRNVQF